MANRHFNYTAQIAQTTTQNVKPNMQFVLPDGIHFDESIGEHVIIVGGEIVNYAFHWSKDISKKWIIAVKMISEGVDIKRLRVGVYATNVVTELSFRQVVGRVVRRQGLDDQWAHFFVPKDNRLVEFMKRIQEERDHVINDDSREIERNGNGDHVRRDPDFIPVAADRNPDNDIVIADKEIFTQTEVEQALSIMQSVGIQASPTQAALAIRKMQGLSPDRQTIPSIFTESPLWTKEKGLRKAITNKANAVAYRIKERCNTSKTAGEIVRKIHFRWTQLGHNKQEDASIEELELKLKWLSQVEDEYWRFI